MRLASEAILSRDLSLKSAIQQIILQKQKTAEKRLCDRASPP
jgi:hypothetical protein